MINLKKIIPKNSDEFITLYLTHDEIKCRCDSELCTFTLIDIRAIRAWKNLREDWKQPITVTSMFRCQNHNYEVGGVIGSYHTTGSAIDLAFPSDPRDVSSFIRLCEKHFPFVKTYNDRGFCHCDLRSI